MENKAIIMTILIVGIVALFVLILMPAKTVVEQPAAYYEAPNVQPNEQKPVMASGSGKIKFSVAKSTAQGTGQIIFNAR